MTEDLYARVEGKGQPFVILHGFLGMSDNWKTLGTAFSEQGYEVHMLDLRNHGRSFHAMEFTYEVMVDDVKRYCDTHQLKNIILLGHSMGGKLAMKLACAYPDLVERLLVADIAPRVYAPHHQSIMQALQAVDFSKQPDRAEVEQMIRPYIDEEGVVQFLMKSVYRENANQLAFRFNLPAFLQDDTAIGEGLEENAVYRQPTLFLRGGRSNYIQQQDEPLIYQHFPHAKIVTIPNAGHWLHAEQPELFFEEVLRFLKA